MTRNKLAHHLITIDEPVKTMLWRAPGAGVKLFTPSAINVPVLDLYAALNPQAVIVYRAHIRYPRFTSAVDDAKQIIAEVASIRHLNLIVEGVNETWQRREKNELAHYANYAIEQAKVLHDAGLRYAVGSFSTQNPTLEDWELFYPALDVADYLALHEYGYPDTQGVVMPGGLLRYREVVSVTPAELRRPILITEYGPVDDGRHGGWRTYLTIEQCVEHMTFYATEVAKDPLVEAVFVFTASCYVDEDGAGDWVQYRYAGERQIEDVFNVAIEGGNTMADDLWSEVGPGVRDKLQQLGDEPATREIWTGQDYSTTFSKAGRRLDYVPGVGTLVFEAD